MPVISQELGSRKDSNPGVSHVTWSGVPQSLWRVTRTKCFMSGLMLLLGRWFGSPLSLGMTVVINKFCYWADCSPSFFVSRYLSITANYTGEWEKWWKNPQQVSEKWTGDSPEWLRIPLREGVVRFPWMTVKSELRIPLSVWGGIYWEFPWISEECTEDFPEVGREGRLKIPLNECLLN